MRGCSVSAGEQDDAGVESMGVIKTIMIIKYRQRVVDSIASLLTKLSALTLTTLRPLPQCKILRFERPSDWVNILGLSSAKFWPQPNAGNL
jgi:hypothetical protein